MKAVLISIKPKWCEMIASGKKTVEVRKTRPKIETPFKVYIYCTKSNDLLATVNGMVQKPNALNLDIKINNKIHELNGKVIGEFICDSFVWVVAHPSIFAGHPLFYLKALDDACLTKDEVEKYSGGMDVIGWHISNLMIYDEPKELTEFIVPSKFGCVNEGKCRGCIYLDRGNGYNVEDDCNAWFSTDDYKPLRKPPQSWCYVEERSRIAFGSRGKGKTKDFLLKCHATVT